MIKNKTKTTKCATIDASDDYRILTDTISNPYNYNFGKKLESQDSNIFKKMHNKINQEFFSKR